MYLTLCLTFSRRLRDKGEDDKMPPIRKKQRGLLLKLQQEQVNTSCYRSVTLGVTTIRLLLSQYTRSCTHRTVTLTDMLAFTHSYTSNTSTLCYNTNTVTFNISTVTPITQLHSVTHVMPLHSVAPVTPLFSVTSVARLHTLYTLSYFVAVTGNDTFICVL